MEELFQCSTAFKEAHKEQHWEMLAKLQHLEKEISAGQEETALQGQRETVPVQRRCA